MGIKLPIPAGVRSRYRAAVRLRGDDTVMRRGGRSLNCLAESGFIISKSALKWIFRSGG